MNSIFLVIFVSLTLIVIYSHQFFFTTSVVKPCNEDNETFVCWVQERCEISYDRLGRFCVIKKVSNMGKSSKCNSTQDCGQFYHCKSINEKRKRCVKFLRSGNICHHSNECDIKAFCNFDKGGKKPNKAPRGICERKRAEGVQCAHDYECLQGLFCSGKCAPKIKVGEKCSRDGECEPGSYCDDFLTFKICIKKALLGHSCVKTEHCKDGLLCEEGYCRRLNDTPCSAESKCESNQFCDGRKSICVEKGGIWDECTFGNYECQDKHSCYNKQICFPEYSPNKVEGEHCVFDSDCGGTGSHYYCRGQSLSQRKCIYGKQEGEECKPEVVIDYFPDLTNEQVCDSRWHLECKKKYWILGGYICKENAPDTPGLDERLLKEFNKQQLNGK